MRKLTLGIISLLLLMVACSQDDLYESNLPENTQSHATANHYYGVKRTQQKNTKGVAQRNNLWSSNTVITVKFLNEPAINDYPNNDVTDRIIRYAKEWEKHAGITFKYVKEGDAMIRIGFDWNEDRYVTWSYIGTDAKMVTDQNEATASFAYFNDLSKEEQKGEVLRLFGQILGLELEHRHLSFDAGWKNRVQSQWEGDIADIPWETLKKYVFDPLETTNAVMTEDYDPLSIMIWPFPRTVAANTERDFNLELSENDKAFIEKLYPKTKDSRMFVGVFATMCRMYNDYSNYIPGFKITYHSQKAPLMVQWEDQAPVNLGNNFEGFVTYKNASLLYFSSLTSIRIYGDADGVTEFNSNEVFKEKEEGDDYRLKRGLPLIGNYDFSKFTNLKILGFMNSGAGIANLQKNTNLEELSLSAEGFDKIDNSLNIHDFTKLTKLKKLYINGLPNTDFSANTNLVELDIAYYYYSPSDMQNDRYSYDFSNNKNLESLSIAIPISANFNILQNSKLKDLKIDIANLNQLNLSKSPELKTLQVNTNTPYQLNLSSNAALEEIRAYGPITKLILSQDKEQKLKLLSFWGPNSITELNVSNSTYLETLSMWYCPNLKEVDVSNNKFLKSAGGSPHDNINIIGWNK